jgi:hypothetical protein
MSITINNIPVLGDSLINDLQKQYGDIWRKIDLDNNTQLCIIDKEGIRYWAKNNQISELQVILNGNKNSQYFPIKNFEGSISINGNAIDAQSKFNSNLIQQLELTLNDDDLRFGIRSYFHNNAVLSYSIIETDDDKIRHISIQFK